MQIKDENMNLENRGKDQDGHNEFVSFDLYVVYVDNCIVHN